MYISGPKYESLKTCIRDKSLEEFKDFFLELSSSTEEKIYWFRDTGPLHIAAEYGRIDIAKYLLTQPVLNVEINVNSTTKGSWFPMHFAASSGHLDMCKFLIKQGARLDYTYKPNYSDEFESDNFVTPNLPTTLHIAAKYNKLAVVKLLLINKADPLAVDRDGNTAFQIAKNNNFLDILANYFEFTEVSHNLSIREDPEITNFFENLPRPIIGEIFSYLDLADIKSSN